MGWETTSSATRPLGQGDGLQTGLPGEAFGVNQFRSALHGVQPIQFQHIGQMEDGSCLGTNLQTSRMKSTTMRTRPVR